MNSSWPIYVTGPMQIAFHLKAPFAYFPGTLVVFEGLIFDSQWVLDNGGFGSPAGVNTYFNQHPIPGTGPYVVTKVSENNYVEFTQNPNYWGDKLTPAQISEQPLFDPGHVKNVILNFVSDDLARYTDLSTGVAQISPVFSADWNLVLASPNKLSYLVAPSWAGIFGAIALNTNYFPTNITLVRQAIVHAINYTDIWNKAFFGQVSPMVGPEYPAWKDFYDLGNYSAYNYNLTLAQKDLKQANVTNMPMFTFRVVTGCDYCTTIAEIVQSDLAQIGMTVNIVMLPSSEYFSPFGSYSTNVADASHIGQMSLVGGAANWAPATLTPADYWLSFVSNSSSWGNQAGYARPDVQPCVNSFTSTQNISFIQSLCKTAEDQIYNDAPYAWLGIMKLWFAGGSLVWNRNIVKSFFVDPVWSGQTDTAIFNTVTFVS
jgi:ABC-type transport system substrate-binding protein